MAQITLPYVAAILPQADQGPHPISNRHFRIFMKNTGSLMTEDTCTNGCLLEFLPSMAQNGMVRTILDVLAAQMLSINIQLCKAFVFVCRVYCRA